MRARVLTFHLTMRCDLKCAHCCQHRIASDLDLVAAAHLLSDAIAQHQVDSVSITGGEPFLKFSLLTKLLEFTHRLNLPSSVITHGKWADSLPAAREKLAPVVNLGVRELAISYDAYHAQFVPFDNIVYLIRVAKSLNVAVTIYATIADDTRDETVAILRQLDSIEHVAIETRNLVPSGAVRELSNSAYAVADLTDKCTIQNLMTIQPSGEVAPCCSAGSHPNLFHGNIHDESFSSLNERLSSSPLLQIIRAEGPLGVLERLPVEEQIKFRERRFAGICHLCYSLMDDPLVVQRTMTMKAPTDLVAKALQV